MSDEFVCERPTREPWLTAWETLTDRRDDPDAMTLTEIETLALHCRETQGKWSTGRWP